MDGSDISIEQFGIGQPVKRREDQRFLTGAGHFTDDIDLPGQAWGYVLRSPHAHARIRSLDTAAAKAAPGVLAIYTIADLDADGISVTVSDGKVELSGQVHSLHEANIAESAAWSAPGVQSVERHLTVTP